MSESQSPFKTSTLIILPVIALLLFAGPSLVTMISELPAFETRQGMGQALLLSLLLPVIGAVIAVIGLVKAVKARNRLKTEQAVKGFVVVNVSLATGVLLSFVGLVFTVALVWLAIDDMPKSNHPFGKAEIAYYGLPDCSELAMNSIVLPDGTLLTGGSRRLKREGGSQWEGMLLKTGLDGKEILTKILPSNGRPRLAATSDGAVLAAMVRTLRADGDSASKVVEMQKLTPNCDSLSARLYRIGDAPEVSEMQALRDGACIVMGGSKLDSLPVTWVFKVSQNGDSLWLKFYPKPAKSFFSQIIELKDGGLVMVGPQPVMEDGQPTDKELLYAMKVDANGDVVWENRKTSTIRGGGADVLEMADGKLLVLANDWHGKNGPETRIVTLNPDGSMDSERPLGGGGQFFYYSFIPWQNGEYLAAGWTPKRDAYYRMTMGSWDTYEIALFTADGKVVKSFHGGREMFEAWGVTTLSENSCIITGFGYTDEAQRTTMKGNGDIGIIRFTM